MIKKLFCIFAAVLFFSGPTQAAAIKVFSSSQNIATGSLLYINIEVFDVINFDSPSLGVFDIDIGFDPLVVSYQGVSWGASLDLFGIGSLQVATPASGSINLFELSLDAVAELNELQPSDFKLATLTFLAQAAGSTWFSILPNSFGDAEGMNLDFVIGMPANVTVTSAVPEPGTLLLFGPGLTAVFLSTCVRKRRTIRALKSKPAYAQWGVES